MRFRDRASAGRELGELIARHGDPFIDPIVLGLPRGGLPVAEAVAAAIDAPIDVPRVLFSTGTYPDPTRFDDRFAALSPELVHHLADHGVRLVGIDTPSVDLVDSKDLPAHHACRERDLAILEGIVLDAVPAGLYELIALPLRLVGFDGSPVRAVLRPLQAESVNPPEQGA